MTPIGKVPPQSLEAEKSVLGCLLLDPTKIADVATVLAADDFYAEAHQTIYRSITSLHGRRITVDLLTLSNELAEHNALDAVGGRSALAELTEYVPTASSVLEYAEIVRRKAALRRLIRIGSEISALGFSDAEDDAGAYATSQQMLLAAMRDKNEDRMYSMERLADEFYTEYAELREGTRVPDTIPTGIDSLDRLLSGFHRSDFIVLAARASMGKTALAGYLAHHAASLGKRTLVFSHEMHPLDVYRRLVAAHSRVDSWRVRSATTADPEHDRVIGAVNATREYPLHVIRAFGFDMAAIRANALKYQASGGLDLLVVDYIGLVRGHDPRNRVQEVSAISRAMKELAQELHVPVIGLSQLNRQVEGRNDKKPFMSDLKESGSLEQDADAVLLLFRPWYYDNNADPAELQVIVAKHRNGPVGAVTIDFDPATSTFRDRPQIPRAAA